MGVKSSNPIVIVLAVIGAFVVLGLVLKVAFKLIGLAVIIGLGLIVYFAVQGAQGRGRP